MRKVKDLSKASFPQPDVVTAAVPAPTEGWDAISPLAAMDPKRAPILINWVPRPGWLELRNGYDTWALLGVSAAVETLMVWHGPNNQQQFFAACQGTIYNVSSQVPTAAVTGLSLDRWQYVTFTPAGGNTYLQLVNGADLLQMYDGNTNAWTVPSITGLPNGATTADIINIYAQKRRLWYIMENSTVAAFMPTDTIMGPIAGTLDLGALWTKGGYLVAMGDWTADSGVGPQDYAVFISSNGQASLYSGTDPTSASAWSLVGTFDLSPPIGMRCFTRVGSDLAIITTQGVLPISQALPFDPSADRSAALTARIQNAMALAAAQASTNFGWQFISYPAEQLFILNVPLTTNSQQVQYVQNALTGAWTQFNGWPANCFEVYSGNLYFGDNAGGIQQAYVGSQDNINPILGDMQCAFNWFQDPGRTKRMTMIQPLIVASGTVSPTLSVDTDFSDIAPAAPVSVIQGGSLWDVAVWDQATWPAGPMTQTSWYSATALGHALAVRLQVNVAATTTATPFGEFDVSLFDTATFDSANTSSEVTLQINAFNTILELGGYV